MGIDQVGQLGHGWTLTTGRRRRGWVGAGPPARQGLAICRWRALRDLNFTATFNTRLLLGHGHLFLEQLLVSVSHFMLSLSALDGQAFGSTMKTVFIYLSKVMMHALNRTFCQDTF